MVITASDVQDFGKRGVSFSKWQKKCIFTGIFLHEKYLWYLQFFLRSFFWENWVWKIEKRIFWQIYVYIYCLLPY